jgi:excisionase family DNA binding protein
LPRKLYRLTEALEYVPFGRTRLYEEMNAGRLRFVQYGSRRLIPEDALEDFLASIEQHAA